MDVKTLCLGALTLGDASGYEIKKMFEEGPFSYFHQAGFGSIYPALNALCDEGLVDMCICAQNDRPDKKVYSITEKGDDALRRKLQKKPAADKIRSETLVMFFLADHLSPEHLHKVYDGYLEAYRAKLQCLYEVQKQEIPPHRQFTSGFGIAFYEAAIDYMENNRHLLFADAEAGDQEKAS